MINRTTKLRWRRRLRRGRKQVGDLSQQTEEHLDKHFFRRLNRLINVRRFIGVWILLMVLLISINLVQTYDLSTYYQTQLPAAGGDYSEGIVGSFSNANPLFATSDVDTTVSRLIFAGLLKYNQDNQLVGDLAQSWTSNSSGIDWTVHLKPNLRWQDGAPLTASDVGFTYHLIQDPDVGSPLFNSFSGVNVKVVNSTTIEFNLPSPLSSFPDSLTNGIVPEHLLSSLPPAAIRSATFNTYNPIGAGPFKWETVQVEGLSSASTEQQIGLVPNHYYYGGTPKLNEFTVDAFSSQNQMIRAFSGRSIDAMVGLNSLPPHFSSNQSIYSYNVPLTAEVMAFFNTSAGVLSDVKVRQALVEGINESKIISGLGYPVIPAKSPLLPFQAGYNPNVLQLSTNVSQAEQLLTQDGWTVGQGGIRYKSGQALTFDLATQSNNEYDYVASSLKSQWRAIGANVQVISEQQTNFQNTLTSRSYNAILYGISIGADPDVFVYWDSSQAAPNAIPGLNLSLYKNPTVDQSIEAGRTVINPELQAIKYLPFLQSWQNDAPALALYQPRFLYVTRGKLYGFSPIMINEDTDRFANVQNWEIQTIKQTNRS